MVRDDRPGRDEAGDQRRDDRRRRRATRPSASAGRQVPVREDSGTARPAMTIGGDEQHLAARSEARCRGHGSAAARAAARQAHTMYRRRDHQDARGEEQRADDVAGHPLDEQRPERTTQRPRRPQRGSARRVSGGLPPALRRLGRSSTRIAHGTQRRRKDVLRRARQAPRPRTRCVFCSPRSVLRGASDRKPRAAGPPRQSSRVSPRRSGRGSASTSLPRAVRRTRPRSARRRSAPGRTGGPRRAGRAAGAAGTARTRRAWRPPRPACSRSRPARIAWRPTTSPANTATRIPVTIAHPIVRLTSRSIS